VWLFTCGLFGIGWIIDVFLIPEFVEEVRAEAAGAAAASGLLPIPIRAAHWARPAGLLKCAGDVPSWRPRRACACLTLPSTHHSPLTHAIYNARHASQHNKRVFHQQMVETGSSLLFDGEYGAPVGGQGFYPTGAGGGGYGQPQQAFAGAVAPYAQHVYYPQQNTQYY
jgi:hypothetical protein